MTIIQRYLIGFLCAFMSVLGFAATFVSAGVLTKNHAVSPLVLAMLRFLIAGGSMLIVGMTIPSVRKSLLNVSKRDWLKILWIGPIGTAIMAWTVFEGCQRVCTANASMADAITPLGIFIISTIRTKHVSLLEFTGLIFGFAGALFVIQVLGPGGLNLSAYTLGDLYILISAIVWGGLCGIRARYNRQNRCLHVHHVVNAHRLRLHVDCISCSYSFPGCGICLINCLPGFHGFSDNL